MKINIEELESKLQKEVIVFVDRKRVGFPVEFDVEEGWVLTKEYFLPNQVDKNIDNKQLKPLEPIEKKIYGKVEIATWEKG